MNSRASDNELLDYYLRELDWLRTQGRDFARRYPKVGARLDLHGGESHDPHTERLIESVAFLAARVRRDIDSDFPQVASALLENGGADVARRSARQSYCRARCAASHGPGRER